MNIPIWKDEKKIQKIIKEWKALSIDLLREQIEKIVDSFGHWEFVRTVYPMIQDVDLKNRVHQILINATTDLSNKTRRIDFSARAVYICAKLHFPETRETILEMIKKIDDPTSFEDPTYIAYLNDAIKELKINEATDFLCKELEMLANIPKTDHERYWKYASAIWALEAINPDLARLYRNKFGLFPAYKSVSEWSQLSYEELKQEIRKNILGLGGWEADRYSSFIPEYYNKIEDIELKEKVNKILFNMIDDIRSGLGERTIYICSNLRLEGIRNKIREIIRNSDAIFETIKKTPVDIEWSTLISYIRGVNGAICLLNIAEAKDFLVGQLDRLKGSMPEPVTKEYYLYHLARTALEALRKIDPQLAKKYE